MTFIQFYSQNLTMFSGVIDAFASSNVAGKIIVVLLVIFSILAWSVMLGKYFDLSNVFLINRQTEFKLSKATSVFDIAASKAIQGPYASLIKEAVAAWARSSNNDDSSIESLSLKMGHVENALQRTLSRQIIKYESKMTLLGSIISGAPFLGLLGTVWGVMDSFGAVGMQASVTLQMLAPGVSGALLTTVAALVVAIPSVFGYNFLLTKSKSMISDMENFASSLADRIELESRITLSPSIPTQTPPAQINYTQQAQTVIDSANHNTSKTSSFIDFDLDDDS